MPRMSSWPCTSVTHTPRPHMRMHGMARAAARVRISLRLLQRERWAPCPMQRAHSVERASRARGADGAGVCGTATGTCEMQGACGMTLTHASECSACQRRHWPAHKRNCRPEVAAAPGLVAAAGAPPAAPAAAAPPTRAPLCGQAVAPPSPGMLEFFGDPIVPVRLASGQVEGRGLVTKGDMPVGSIVVVAEAYACVPTPSQSDRICARCFGTSASMLRCSACRAAAFCSRECMAAHAPVHQGECCGLGAVRGATLAFESEAEVAQEALRRCGAAASDDPDPSSGVADAPAVLADRETLGLLVALLNRARAEREPVAESERGRGVQREADWQDVMALATHDHDPALRVAALQAAREAAAVLADWLGTLPPTLAQENVLAGLLLRIRLNAHPVVNGYGQRVGLGLYPMAALVNHSCLPNVTAAAVQGRTIVMRALRALRAGEQVCSAYVDVYQPRAVRQRLLRSGFGFLCACARCRAPLLESPDRLAAAYVCRARPGSCRRELVRCRSIVQSDPASFLDAPDDEYRCPGCGSSRRAGELLRAAAEVDAATQLAVAALTVAPATAHQQLRALAAGPVLRLLHPLHRARFDLSLALIASANAVRDLETCADETMRAIACAEALVNVGTPELASLYFTLARAVFALLGDLFPPARLQQRDPATEIEKQLFTRCASALEAARRLREVCFGTEAHAAREVSALAERFRALVDAVSDVGAGAATRGH